MSLRDNLSEVSKDLAKILDQLKQIKKTANDVSGTKISVGGSGRGSGGGGGGKASNGMPEGNFGTPPPQPGSNLGGITPASRGFDAQRGDGQTSGGTPGWAKAAALTGAAAVTYGYSITPGVEDAFAAQGLKFRASFLGGIGGYNADYYKKAQQAFGTRQTDPFGMMTAANIATMSGQGMGTSGFNRFMRETSVTSQIFGMSNAASAGAQASMNSGTFAGRMAKYGIFVSDLGTGNPQGLGNLVDQIWSRHYGSPSRKIPYESVAQSIRGGWLGVFLNRNFGDVPELREQVTQALLLKAQSGGSKLDYSDLGKTNYGNENLVKIKAGAGTRSAMSAATSLGMNDESNPMLATMELQGVRGNVIDGASEGLLSGYRNSVYAARTVDTAVQSIVSNGNGLVNFVLSLKGALEGFGSLGELSPIMGMLGGMFGGGLLGGRATGGYGTTTSDSIPAMLSKGEYVINARAAQMIGTDQLNAMNALGHSFGGGFASPAKAFNKGGSADGGGVVTSDDVLRLARTKLGAPYVVGADGPDKFDCSGFTEWIYETNFGIPLSEVSYTQVNEHQLVAKAKGPGDTVDASLARPGDLLFFDTDAHEADPSGLGISHVAIYSGNNHIIHAWGPPLAETDLANYSSPLRAITRLPLADAQPLSNTSTTASPKSAGGKGEPPGNYSSGPSVMGPRARKITARSVSPYSGGASGLGLGSGSFSWLAQTAATLSGASLGVGSSVTDGKNSTVTETDESGGATSGNSVPNPGNPGSGSGPAWLLEFLASKGLRGTTLKTAWTIGMRESGGNPGNTTNGGSENWNYSGSPHYDVGVWQINNRHLSGIKSKYGSDATMQLMLDPNKNYEYASQLSSNWSNLLAWGMNADGTFDDNSWRYYSAEWQAKYRAATERNTADWYSKFQSYNTNGYSEGAYRTHEGMAKLHEGEMVLPATVAEKFRDVMRGASGPSNATGRTVNVTLKIEKASDEEAERFAKKVKQYLDEDNWAAAVRSA